MPKPISPSDTRELRRLLSTTSHTFTSLANDSWLKDFSPAELKAIFSRGDDKIRKQISDFNRAVAANPSTAEDILGELARDGDSAVRVAAASNPRTPVETLAVLSRDSDITVRIAAASNPNTPTDSLAGLTADPFGVLRKVAASNPNTKGEGLETFARDNLGIVRSAAASNSNTPLEVLAGLARDTDSAVRKGVASNPNTPAEVLSQLARDEDSSIRMAVAMNSSAPQTALQSLAEDNDWAVRKVASSNPKAPSVGKKEGCFLATAATGSYDHEITRTLRNFRDTSLESSALGRRFIQWYYEKSPNWALWITRHSWIRMGVKWIFLYPISRILKLTIPN
jgi:hypothetical protein